MKPEDRPIVIGLAALTCALVVNIVFEPLSGSLGFFLNSTFITALMGAFAGAYGGQWIVERSKVREELLREIRNTNAAIVIAGSICNTSISLKKQHVKSLKDTYDQQRNSFRNFQEQVTTGTIDPMLPFKLKTDFRTLSLLAFPTDILKTQVFERLSLTGRPLSLTAILVQTANSLNANLQSRNDLIQAIKAAGMIPPDELARIYFGLSTRDGHTDQSYPDLLNGTYGHTDDVIFFSHLLCQDLIAHGERLRSQWSKRYLRNRPILNKYDFKQAIDEGLMPDDKNYEDWLNIPSR